MVLLVGPAAGDGHGVEEGRVVSLRRAVVGQPLVVGVDPLVGDGELEGHAGLEVLQGHAGGGEPGVGARVGGGGAEGLALGAVRGAGHPRLAGQLLAGRDVEAEPTAGGLLVRVHQPLDVVERAGQPAGVLRAHGLPEGRLAGRGVGSAGDDLEPAVRGGGHHPVPADSRTERQERPLGVRALGVEAAGEVVLPDGAALLGGLRASRAAGGGQRGAGGTRRQGGGGGGDDGTAADGHVGSFPTCDPAVAGLVRRSPAPGPEPCGDPVGAGPVR